MKIAFLNDTHCGVRNSSDIFLDYQEKFYSDVFFPYLKENNITHIVHLGDYYDHRKYINFKAQNHNRKVFLDVLKKEGITMDIIPGNHDVFYKNTNELNSLKELLGYYVNNVNIVMEPRVMDYDGCNMALVPWINPDNHNKTLDFLSKCKADFVGGHFEFEGFDMMKGVKATEGLDKDVKWVDRFEAIYSGHYHTKSSQGNIHYLGTQFELTWTDVDDAKYFHVFDTETREMTPVRNPHTIFQKIYYDDEKYNYSDFKIDNMDFDNKFVKLVVVNKTDPFTFDKFLDRINKQNIFELKIAETFDEFLGENADDDKISVEDTTTLMNTYIDSIDTNLDKNRLKSMMNQLYTEAMNLEVL